MADETGNEAGQGFESGDVAPRAVGLWAYGLFAIAVAMAAGVYFLWGGLQALVREPRPSPVEVAPMIPPEPHLQPSPSADLARLLSRDRRRLNSTAWVDRSGGVAHIPVDRAMRMLADRGWPKSKGGGQ